MAPVQTPAILLRAHAYSETSRVLRFYTRDLGLVAVMARGVRRGEGKGGSSLDTFAEGILTVHLKRGRDLQTFREFDLTRPHRALAAHPLRFGGGAALCELVLRTVEADPNPALFDQLTESLALLESEAEDRLPAVVLARLWLLVGALGFGPELERCVRCGVEPGPLEMGRFDLPGGGILCGECGEGRPGPRLGPEARRQLAGLLSGVPPAALRRPRAHLRLLSDFVRHHLSAGAEIRSMEFLLGAMPPHA